MQSTITTLEREVVLAEFKRLHFKQTCDFSACETIDFLRHITYGRNCLLIVYAYYLNLTL